jgi:hypothetical protein
MANGTPILISSDCIYLFINERFQAVEQVTKVLLRLIKNLHTFSVGHRMSLKTEIKNENIKTLMEIENTINLYKKKAEKMGYDYRDAGFDGGFHIDTIIPSDYITFIISYNELYFVSEFEKSELKRYMKKNNENAYENVNQLIILMKEIGTLPIMKELWAYENKKVIFVGEPYLWYRPKSIFEKIEDPVKCEEAIDIFWEMYNIISENIPTEIITKILKNNSFEYEELNNKKIYVRLCKTFDEILYKSKPILNEVEKTINDYLDEKGIERSW